MDRIILDPGHGGEFAVLGSSPNHASGPNGLREKDLALDIANRVSRMLAGEAEVRLTRAMDVNLSLSARAGVARDAGAAVFVSLHFNASPDPQADGAEAWIARDATPRSRALAENLAAKLANATGAPNRGVRQSNLGVLLSERHSRETAACLVEMAFLTNSRQAGRLVQSDYRDALAAAIAAGVRENLHGEAAATQGWSGALGGSKPDKPSDFPKELRVYWADPRQRLFHHYWHLARQNWSSLAKTERDDIRTFGFSVPPPRLAGTPGSGLDFLFMHRHMVQATRDFTVARKLKYRPLAWDPIPWNHDDPNWPMPVIAAAENFKDKSITEYWRKKVRNEYRAEKWLKSVELDDLGATIEDGIHNWLHLHWSTEEPADIGITSVSNDWLGHPFSAAVNPVFWKLHPWIDDLIDRWEAAQKAGKTGRSIAAALKGFTPWIGASLTSPAPAKTHALAEMPHRHHGVELPPEEVEARIARLDFEKWQPFPFARLSLEQLRRRFGPENETSGPALVAGWDGDDASSLVIAVAQASKCEHDEAATDNIALLISDEAPLPVTKAVKDAANADAKLDFHAVCAIVPDTPDPTLLIYFHGDREYVTVTKKGNIKIDATGHSRMPRWATGKVARNGVETKPATAIHERLDQLGKDQKAVKLPKDLDAPRIKEPVVLVPQAGEPTNNKDHWTTPPAGQYTDAARMERLVVDCYEHLRCFKKPSGAPYLPDSAKNVASWAGNLRRVYLVAHSGGSKPASECAASEMMLIGPKSAMGTGGHAADLWLLDATYGFSKSIDRYETFCKNWQDQRKLAYAADCARLVCIYRPMDPDSDSETETGADELRKRVAKLLGVTSSKLLFRDDGDDMGSKTMLTRVIPALLSSPAVFVRTNVAHRNIPSSFIPLLLRTAAS